MALRTAGVTPRVTLTAHRHLRGRTGRGFGPKAAGLSRVEPTCVSRASHEPSHLCCNECKHNVTANGHAYGSWSCLSATAPTAKAYGSGRTPWSRHTHGYANGSGRASRSRRAYGRAYGLSRATRLRHAYGYHGHAYGYGRASRSHRAYG